jgi:fermentation-respiration switch protein FrsA (DUF1100 family)
MRRSRALLVLLATALGTGTLAAPTAVAAPPDGGQPRPGYTITLPDLAPLTVAGGPTRVLTGVVEHAGYAVEVPPRWNGELVVWAHGFRGDGPELVVEPPAFGLRERFVEQGYAWAASSYDRNGYDVASGVRSSRALVREFRRLVDRPERTYLAGVSMGGHVAARSLEQYPGLYDGALPMCGVLGDQELFDYFLDHTVAAQALAGVPAYPAPADYATNALPRIYAALGLAPGDPAVPTPAAQQLRAATVLDSGGPRPGAEAAYAYWKDFLLGLAVPPAGPSPVTGLARTPGDVATNVGTDYAPDSPVDLDAVVQRVPPADPRARRTGALTPVPRVDSRPRVPVLTLHGLGDLFVPFSMEQDYAAEAAERGRADLVVQRAVRTTAHCEFSPVEAGTAWDDLVAWVGGGDRPAGDAVLDPAAVADPSFGCAFSDPAAYAAAGPPSQTDTRRLFAPCPSGGS